MQDPEHPLPLGYAPASPDHRARLREVAGLFMRLGFTAFGGPAVHIALMEDEVVRRRQWLDRRHFLDLVAALNFIPGPNSTELAIHLGLIRAGHRGLLVAGACFILPAVMIILPLAWAYVRFGRMPQVQGMLDGIAAAVIAILAMAFWRFAKASVRDAFTAAIALSAVAGSLLLARRPHWQPELLILASSAVFGAMWHSRPAHLRLPLFGALSLAIAPPREGWEAIGRMFLLFLKIGATLFGSGYVLVSYLRTGLVEQNGWLTESQLLDAVAIGQVTPGPLLTTATFIGFILGDRFVGGWAGGIAGGLLATAGIFLPSFILVALFARVLPRLRQNRYVRGALDAMNAAVAALILVVTISLARQAIYDPFAGDLDLFAAAVCVAAFVALSVWEINTTWIIVVAGALGLARQSVMGRI